MSRLNTVNTTADTPNSFPGRLLTRAPLLVLFSILFIGGFLHLSGFFDRLSAHALKRLDKKMVSYGMNLSHVYVRGAKRTSSASILKSIGIGPKEAFRAIDLAQAYTALRNLPWIKEAVVERRWPNTLMVTVTERQPLALWQHRQKIQLVDTEGQPIPLIDIAQFTTYPLIIGEGAPGAASTFLSQLSRIPHLRPHIQTMIRVGQRRWNIKLKTGLTIMLPEDNVEKALDLLNTLHTNHNITEMAQKNLDLRIPQKVIYE